MSLLRRLSRAVTVLAFTFIIPVQADSAPPRAVTSLGQYSENCVQNSPGVEPPAIALQVHVACSVPENQEIEYHIIAENRTMSDAHHVVVHNQLPSNARFVRAEPQAAGVEPEMQWQLGTVKARTRHRITLVLEPTGEGEIENCVRVTMEHGVCVKTRICRAEKKPPPPPMPDPPRPALEVSKRGPTTAVVGEKLTYRVTVTNRGDGPAQGVRLVDELPDGLEHEEGKRRLSYEVGDLNPGEAKFAQYEVIARQPGRHTNRATATSDEGIQEQVEHSVDVGQASLKLEKTGPQRAYATSRVEYRITATNDGTVPLNNVLIADNLPQGTIFIEAPGSRTAEGGVQVQWPIGRLMPQESRTFLVAVRPVREAVITNEAIAVAEPNIRLTEEVQTQVIGVAGLNIDVTDDDPVELGGRIRYVLRIENEGSAPASNIALKAVIPGNMSFERIETNNGENVPHTLEGQNVVIQPFNLNPGQRVVVHLFVRANEPDDSRFRLEVNADLLTSGTYIKEEPTNVYDPNRGNGQ